PAQTLLEGVLSHGRFPPDNLLAIARALAERRQGRLAGLVARELLDRLSDDLTAAGRRTAELLIAQALRQEGADRSLRAAARLLDGIVDAHASERHNQDRLHALALLSRTKGLLGEAAEALR